ncbi:MAG: hypothetical protein HYS59_02105 [Candidatus Vogelbacteria bacterium]|nr:hypothetical protein [Candidatus Vogelbacteria bacterium]
MADLEQTQTKIAVGESGGATGAPVAPPPPAPQPEFTLPVVRTYKQDLKTTVAEKKVSLSGIAAAAANRRERDTTLPGTRLSKTLQALGAIAFVVVALGLIWYGIRYTNAPKTVPSSGAGDMLVFAETGEDFDLTGRLPVDIRQFIAAALRTANIRIGSVHSLNFTVAGDGEPPTRFRAAAPFFLSAIESTVPDELRRNLAPEFMLGIFSFTRNTAFLILKPSRYEIAFAHMLEWETDISRDLYPILTGGPAAAETIAARFEDRLLRNHDARVSVGPDGVIRLVYSFIDRQTLVIAPDIETFTEVLTRLGTPRPVSR